VTFKKIPFALALLAVSAAAQTISFAPLSISSTSTSGASFVYSGVLTQAATLNLNVSGVPCLQNGAYCTNAAGVVLVAGTSGVGAASTFTGTFFGTTQTWTFGSLAIGISGVGAAEVFAANAANGLGSGTPPAALTLAPKSLASLGFGNFSVTNPTITFFLVDSLYTDNSGSFSVSAVGVPATPAPSTLLLSIAGLAALSFFVLANRRRRLSEAD
jgi:hypothetical protein